MHPPAVPTDPSARPLVLLLAGDARDALKKALEAIQLEVTATGWLDGITAARQRRPTLLLVSSDLPEGAVSSVVNGFRNATELHDLPIIVAGPGADRLDQEAGRFRADHYLARPKAPLALAREVVEVVRTGQLRPPLRHPWMVAAGVAVAALAGLGLATAGLFRLTAFGRWLQPARPFFPMVMALGWIAAALAGSRRPDGRLSVAQWRSVLVWSGLLLGNLGAGIKRGQPAATTAGLTLAFLAWAAWAWLGPRAKERTPRVARAFRILAGVLAAASVIPWFFVT